MLHHDGRGYDEAAGAAGAKGREVIDREIAKGREQAGRVIEAVQSRLVVDAVVKTPAMRIEPADGRWNFTAGDISAPLHRHALSQTLELASIPKRFADDLEERANGTPWGRDLLAHNLNTIFAHANGKRQLVRREGGEVKGILSDKFRRLDSRPLLDAFCAACKEHDLLPLGGAALDTKVHLRAIMPRVFEPIPNEVMAFGLQWQNSDYGDGGHAVSLWVLRCWCTNLAVGEQVLRQVHLGRRLDDDIAYSERTYQLDTQTNASALKDVVRAAIGPARVNEMLNNVRKAGESEVKGREGVLKALKGQVDKGTAEKIADVFEGPDVVNVPPGQNAWRLSNAVSWLAHDKGNSDAKRLELETVAGRLLPHGNGKAIEV